MPRHSTTFQSAMTKLRSDYNIGSDSRFRRDRAGVSSTGTNADYHIRSEAAYFKGIEVARAIDRDDMIVGQGINRFCDNVLQETGMKLEPMTEDETVDEILYRRWHAWAGDKLQCSANRRHNFYDVAWLTLRHAIVDGDILQLPLTTGQLQSIEAHRLRSPKLSKNDRRQMVHGVLLDEMSGAAKQYWISKLDVDINYPLPKLNDMTQYDAFETDSEGRIWPSVFHIFDPKRFSQSRGITALNPIVDPASMHDDLQFATLVKAQVAASYTIFEEVMPGMDTYSSTADQTGSREETTRDDGSTEITEELAPGMRIKGKPGHKLTGFAPNVPNAEFFDHSMLILTIIAVNLGVPVAVLLLDPSQTNFSGWRGAMDQARIGFRRTQRWLTDSLYQPVYHWKVRQWLGEESDDGDALRAAQASDVDVFAHIWKCPRWPYIEPDKDAQTHQRRFGNTLTSPRRLFGENGEDWQEIFDETIEDRAYAIRQAKAEAAAINKEFSDDLPVTWMHLCPLPMAEATAVKADPEPEPAPAAAPAGAKKNGKKNGK